MMIINLTIPIPIEGRR